MCYWREAAQGVQLEVVGNWEFSQSEVEDRLMREKAKRNLVSRSISNRAANYLVKDPTTNIHTLFQPLFC